MIAAGGTGGHVFPGLAVADALRDSGWRVVWLGSQSGMEATLVSRRGYDMAAVKFSGVRGKGPVAVFLLPLRLLVAFWQSARAILARRPDVVLGMGGYMSFPGGMMAALLGRPLVIHEQNSIAGLANRVRAEIGAIPEPKARYAGRSGPLRVLVVGGSLGAKALNDTVPRALALLPAATRPVVTHQSGAQHLEALKAAYAAAGVQADARAFIDDMAAEYAGVDLAICRAGATTVAELAAAGVPSVLVPFPHAVDDHQTRNARFLSDAGAAVLLPQSELAPERLAALLAGFDRARLLEMAGRARSLGRPEATRSVAQACVELAP